MQDKVPTTDVTWCTSLMGPYFCIMWRKTPIGILYMVLVIDPWTQNIYGFSVLSFTVFPVELLKNNHQHKNATCTLKVFYYDAQAIKYTEKIFPL